MRKRREKGLGLIIVIIIFCLFLMFTLKGPFSMRKGTGMADGSVPERSGENLRNDLPPDDLPGNDIPDVLKSDISNVMDNDISLTDSLGVPATEIQEESRDNLTFLINNLSYERTGSERMMAVVGGLLILYLIIIGPVTYFYLKRIGKMERMWIILPTVSLLFGCIVLLMSNDFIIREPHVDILKVVTPGQKSVCYGASTSPGDDSYSLFFNDSVEALLPWIISDEYVIDDMERSFTLRPDYAFEKDYFQFKMGGTENKQFIHNIGIEEQIGTGTLYNTTGYNFTHIMLCYGDNYCVLSGMDAGDKCQVDAEDWKKDEHGMIGSLKEELQLHGGLSNDEEKIFNFAWYQHVNRNPDQLHITAISKDGDMGIIKSGVNLISYSLFYQ